MPKIDDFIVSPMTGVVNKTYNESIKFKKLYSDRVNDLTVTNDGNDGQLLFSPIVGKIIDISAYESKLETKTERTTNENVGDFFRSSHRQQFDFSESLDEMTISSGARGRVRIFIRGAVFMSFSFDIGEGKPLDSFRLHSRIGANVRTGEMIVEFLKETRRCYIQMPWHLVGLLVEDGDTVEGSVTRLARITK